MPFYAYQCDSCGTVESMIRGDTLRCPNCGLAAKRRWGVAITKGSFPGGHFNHAAGQYVENETALKDAFKRTSEEQTKLTGNLVTIEPVDYRDRDVCGISDSDVDRIAKEKRDVPA